MKILKLTKREIKDYCKKVKQILKRDLTIYDIKEIERISSNIQFSQSLHHTI